MKKTVTLPALFLALLLFFTGCSFGESREEVHSIAGNVLEYSEKSPHYGFIRRCFDSTEPQIFAAIKKTLDNGGKQ